MFDSGFRFLFYHVVLTNKFSINKFIYFHFLQIDDDTSAENPKVKFEKIE